MANETATPTYRQIVGRNVRRARTDTGMSQDALGEAMAQFLKEPWVKQTVWRVENGKRAVDADELVALAFLLNVSVAALLTPAWDEAMRSRGMGQVILPSGNSLNAADITEKVAPRGDMGQIESAFAALADEVAELRAEVRGGPANKPDEGEAELPQLPTKMPVSRNDIHEPTAGERSTGASVAPVRRGRPKSPKGKQKRSPR
jgi:transcriptional regulator with XRE-family HTH domain